MRFRDFREHISATFLSGNWIFRGQSNIEWGLISSFYRFCDQNDIPYSFSTFKPFLDEFISSGSNLLDKDFNKLNIIQQMALAQHHGLPTPLMDWSFSPYVALYFAARDHSLTPSISFSDIRIWALPVKEIPYLNNDITTDELMVQKFGIIKLNLLSTKRLRRQLGCFTFQGFAGDLQNEYKNFGLDLRSFDVEVDSLSVMLELDLMGINSGLLFDDLSGVAEDIKMKIILKTSRI